MAGWIDVHCHLLPGVDDGSVDYAMSREMAYQLLDAGFEMVTPSPHYGFGPGGHVVPAKTHEVLGRLQDDFRAHGVEIELLPNSEHHICPEMFGFFDRNEIVTLGGKSRWVLVELPWHPIPNPEAIIFRLATKGYKLILAHPERYRYVDRTMVERLVGRGLLMQLEMGSFTGVYGKRAQERAWRYLERGWAHVLSTDLHRPNLGTFFDEAVNAIEQRFSRATLDRGFSENPRKLLDDASGDQVEPMVA